MKRGLIEWNPDELSREVLDGRVARCQALLAERGLDAAICYTSVAQPGLSRYFVHFLPYWNEGVLVIPRAGAPMLCVGLSNRVFPWIKSSSTLTEIRASHNLGADAARALQERGARRVGLADRGSIPHRVIAELESALVGGEVVDLPQVVQTFGLGLDPDELRLRAEAGRRVAAALVEAGTPSASATDSALAARLDRAVRLAGAEDVLVLVGPAGQWPGLPHQTPLDGPTNVMMQVEYKGHWVQVGRALGVDGGPVADAAALGSLCQSGRTVREIAALARAEHGLDAFVSRSGRGNPFVGLAEQDRLAEGDIIAVLALQGGSAGLLCGDTFAVQAGGATSLS